MPNQVAIKNVPQIDTRNLTKGGHPSYFFFGFVAGSVAWKTQATMFPLRNTD